MCKQLRMECLVIGSGGEIMAAGKEEALCLGINGDDCDVEKRSSVVMSRTVDQAMNITGI
ncbi:hypothetical protein L484_023548 [Morus notabilis]|uniref:Uncharacterized protein n=1 Tax=Morus notabilis TaxID=981085 RepID=W9R703_9ROSA|nr:hypothetical protein L484_023548 [Morus notabilis]